MRAKFLGPELRDEPIGSRPTALVLSGGAALGSWQGGVLYALEKAGFMPHSVVGTSIGAINGAAYLQGNMPLLKEIWRSLPRSRFMRWSLGLNPIRLWSTDSVRDYLSEVVDEEECRRRKRFWYYCVAADAAHGETVQYEFAPKDEGPWDGPLIQKISGSMAVPFLFAPVKVPHPEPGQPPRMLIDGHLTSTLFLDRCAARGALDFVFVNVISDVEMKNPKFTPRAFIGTLIHQLLNAQIENGMEPFRFGFREVGIRAFVLRPSEPLDISVFMFNPGECRWGFDLGMKDGASWLTAPAASRIF